jgi:Ca-activated chloride channel family protein
VNVKEYKTAPLVFIIMVSVSAASVKDTVHRGNKLYEKGSYSEAIKQYDQSLIDQPQLSETKYNKANCYFRLDDIAKAIDLYGEVAAESKNMELVAKAKYNLGNCYFRQGNKQKDSNLQKAIENLQTAIACWRSALEINPQNEKAKRNIEVARLIIKDFIDQLNEQKEQQQQQEDKQKQLQEQLKELLHQQKSLAKKTQQTNDRLNKNEINQQQAADGFTKQAEEQSQLKTKTEETLQQLQQQDANSSQFSQIQQAARELEQAVSSQTDAQTQLQNSNGTAAKQSEDKATEYLENTLKALSQDTPQGQQQHQNQQQQEPNQPSEQQDQQQQQQQQAAFAPDATAQEILDKEQREKKQRQILQRADYQKVEKDW